MGQKVTKMMPGSLVCMCVIIDVVALLIFVMFLVIAPPPAL